LSHQSKSARRIPQFLIAQFIFWPGMTIYFIYNNISFLKIDLYNRYIAKKLTKKTKCDFCSHGLNNFNENTSAEAQLVNLKSRGYLTHPNNNLFQMLKNLELCFTLHANSNNVFEETLDDFFNKFTNLTFPCTEHQTEILTDICSSFVIMRMRQCTYIKNNLDKKQNKTKKKLSKLVAS